MNRCELSKIWLKYYNEDWACGELIRRFSSCCNLCIEKSNARSKERSKKGKEEEDAMESIPCEPNPILGVTQDRIGKATVDILEFYRTKPLKESDIPSFENLHPQLKANN